MSRRSRVRRSLILDFLEQRLAMSHASAAIARPAALHATASAAATGLVGDINGDGTVDLQDLQTLAQSYGTTAKQSGYNPAADLDHNGLIGQSDAKILEAHLPKFYKPSQKLTLYVTLAPGQLVAHPAPLSNSGPVTNNRVVTVVGKTLPGALVFADNLKGYYNFNGPLLPTDAKGRFTYTLSTDGAPQTATVAGVTTSSGSSGTATSGSSTSSGAGSNTAGSSSTTAVTSDQLTNLDLLVIDRYGRQLVFNVPIVRLVHSAKKQI